MLNLRSMITRYLRAALLIALVASAYGQVPSRATVGPHDFAGCKPVSERTGETGCWIIVSEPVGQLPLRPMFWHLDRYLTRSDAEKAKGPRGTVVDSLGKIWLLTIADADWRPGGSEHLAEIGPLPVDPNTSYTTQYMEAIMPPGLQTSTHRHSGPEAWYTESGETCLETPAGKQVGRKDVFVVVPGGQPMRLAVTGTEQRRSLVLVLFDASHPWMEPAHDWTPKGLCRK